VVKPAFTLIELIFAIVLIAISVLSLPMLNQVIAKNNDHGILQEAIFAAATELNEATTAFWDENSLDNSTSYARVIDTGSCDNNTSSSRFRLMPGHITQPLHRRCVDDNTTTISNASTNAAVDALDDKEHAERDIFINASVSAQGYKDTYKSILSVTPNANFGGANNQNIKKIEVTIKKNDGTIISKLITYSANIGEVDYYKKAY